MTELAWMTGLGLAFAAGLWMVLGSRQQAGLSNAQRLKFNAAALRAELAELESRREAGEISPDEFERARALLGDAARSDLKGERAWGFRPFSATQKWVLALSPVLFSAGIFLISDGSQHFRPFQSEAQAQAQPSIEEMVDGLARRLEQQPDDLRGWAMLGRSYSVMDRHAEAARAFERANALSDGRNAELLIAEAEARGMANNQRLAGRPMELIRAALALQPDHVRALWYALVGAAQQGDAAARDEYLGKLAAHPELPPEMAEILRNDFGVEPAATAAASGPVIPVQVDLAAGVADQVPDTATLFVYAKAQQGPPMPLAVHRQPLGGTQWPLRVRLDDSMSMLPGMTLSSFSAWTLVARISETGQAIPQSGDWMVSVALDQLPAEPVRLTIAEQIP